MGGAQPWVTCPRDPPWLLCAVGDRPCSCCSRRRRTRCVSWRLRAGWVPAYSPSHDDDPHAACPPSTTADTALSAHCRCSQSYDDEERELRTSYFPGSPLERYLAASPSDFVDEFESLPNDVNPLDPGPHATTPAADMLQYPVHCANFHHACFSSCGVSALMDPAIARRGRLRILQPGVQQQFQRQRAFFMMQNARARAAAYGGANLLNPDLPLMELFWRTLLPWNRIDDRRGMGRF